MDFYYVIVTIVLIISLWNLTIAILGLFPHFLSTAIGTLNDTNTKKNFRTRRGRIIPILTRYTYIYTVKGKQYRYSAHVRHSKRRLSPKIVMAYVKWFPRCAYPNKFKGEKEWALGLVMLYAGIRLLYVLISV